jgi:mRNA-degrading endonuclease YafQ of YafQ-DinJ toxin-antitoxin module
MASPVYVFKRTPQFKKSFDALSSEDQTAAREAFKKFKADPKDASLKCHKINRLTALRGKTIRSIVIKGNLRAVFTTDGNTIISEDIGTHDIYK